MGSYSLLGGPLAQNNRRFCIHTIPLPMHHRLADLIFELSVYLWVGRPYLLLKTELTGAETAEAVS